MFYSLLKLQKEFLTNFSNIWKGTDGLYEIRIEFHGNIFRIFCCFDEGKIVVLFNGFQKKSQKTPTVEIEKALKLKYEYFVKKFKNIRDENKKSNK